MNHQRDYAPYAGQQNSALDARFNRRKNVDAAREHKDDQRPERGGRNHTPLCGVLQIIIVSVIEQTIQRVCLVPAENILVFARPYAPRVSLDHFNGYAKPLPSSILNLLTLA